MEVMHRRRLCRRNYDVHCINMLKPPTAPQKKIARELKIKLSGQSRRVLAALILDKLEDNAFKAAAKLKLAPGSKVRYFGKETDLKHKVLTVTAITDRGFVTFKGTQQFARPHNLKPE